MLSVRLTVTAVVASRIRGGIDSGTAVQHVIANATIQQVIAGPTVERVNAGATKQKVVAIIATQRIVRGGANKDISGALCSYL